MKIYPYHVWILISILCAGLVLLPFLRRAKLPLWMAPVMVLFGTLLGILVGKLTYCILLYKWVWPRWGWSSLLRTRPGEFSFFGCCLGATIGLFCTARLFRQRPARLLDSVAPVAALLVCVSRAGEYSLDMLGLGHYLEAESFQFFPIAICNEWQEWYLAIFIFEALSAFCCALYALLSGHRLADRPGLLFRRTTVYLALTQILLESLRSECMKWGFVRIEQVLCAVCVVALTVYGFCRTTGKKKPLPLVIMLLCIVLIIGVEFALDKTQIPHLVCYLVMAASLVTMGICEKKVSDREQFIA